MMDEDQAQLLALLTEGYADDLPQIRERTPLASITALLYAVHAHQAQRVFACDPRWRETAGITEVPEDRADDVAAALALLQVARDDLEGLEGALLLAARTASTRTGRGLILVDSRIQLSRVLPPMRRCSHCVCWGRRRGMVCAVRQLALWPSMANLLSCRRRCPKRSSV
ncbi:hypothetical protein [Streptomyces sp. NPDC058451]|uniref:hypothetical protein n=1 Tax=Streptomyces sp. NPDC058451 TaxID=3346506 RepID=UPI003665CEE7